MLILMRRRGESVVLYVGDESQTLIIEEIISYNMVTIKIGPTNAYLYKMDSYTFKLGGHQVSVRVNEINETQIVLGFDAPSEVKIMRGELLCDS